LGIHDNGKNYELCLETGHRLSSLLAVTIQRTLEALDLRVSDMDYFACGLGPGSFTGIRVGVAAIKGLSLALKKPVVAIPTLDLLAMNASAHKGNIVAAVDAKRSLIYCGFYRNGPGGMKRVAPYMLLSPEAFCKKVLPGSFVLGDATALYKEDMLKRIRSVNLMDSSRWYPACDKLITLALEKIKNRKLEDAFSINPIYLYPKECQIKKVKGKR
jgi:tRNA threonylcarbamoyl adenosine modification protein YeaZ